MLYLIQVILLALALANALPATRIQSEQEISDNDIDDNDFDNDLPYEVEYYRTSTDRDVFVRPIASPEDNEIDEGDDGIDLDDLNTFESTTNCTYYIAIRQFYESIDEFDLKLEGLTVKSSPKNNITLGEFVQGAQTQIFYNIKGKNFTNELVSGIITYLRQTFVKTFGHEDYCGVSTNVVTYFTKNDTQVDSPQLSDEETTTDDPTEVAVEVTKEVPVESEATIPVKVPSVVSDETSIRIPVEMSSSEALDKNSSGLEFESDTEIPDIEITTEAEADATTEEYESRILTRPQLSETVQDVINVYKALNNWKYPQQP